MTGARGEVRVSTIEGDITVQGGSGFVALQSVDGDLLLSEASGQVSLSTVDGTITVRGVRGDLTANAVDGEILMEGIAARRVDASTVDGGIEFEGTLESGGRYRLTSHDGDVTVIAPVINAEVSVSTFSGEFESDFPVTITGAGSRTRLNFTLGNGGARLELESFDGTVSLRRGGGVSSLSGLPHNPGAVMRSLAFAIALPALPRRPPGRAGLPLAGRPRQRQDARGARYQRPRPRDPRLRRSGAGHRHQARQGR